MLTIKRVDITEADKLLTYSKEVFFHFFGPLNDAVHMEAYSSIAFTPQKMREELSNPNSEFYFALDDDEIAGYLKLNFKDAQNEFKEDNSLEVERIYVSAQHHGKHIGRLLLNFSVDIALQRQLDYIWLGVWEHNHKAIGFYQHHGFEIFGSHDFMLGEDRQIDLLMKKVIV